MKNRFNHIRESEVPTVPSGAGVLGIGMAAAAKAAEAAKDKTPIPTVPSGAGVLGIGMAAAAAAAAAAKAQDPAAIERAARQYRREYRQRQADQESSKNWIRKSDDSESGSSPSSGSIATIGSSFYDSGKIEQPKVHKFMKASFDPTQSSKNYIQEKNNRQMEIKESISRMFVVSEGDNKTRQERERELIRHNIDMEKSREEIRQIRQQKKDRERETRDAKTMERYGGENEESQIQRLIKGGVAQDKIDTLPAGGLERAKALQRLAIANSYASAAKTTANFHNLPLGRAAANEILRQQGKDPLPDTATGEDVKGIFIQSRAQAKADKAAYTASQRPKTPAEQAAWLADYKEGERQHRLAKIREFDPQSANALERAHRADQRFNSAQQQWGDISAELDRSMDDIEDQRTQRKIDAFKRNIEHDRTIQAEKDKEAGDIAATQGMTELEAEEKIGAERVADPTAPGGYRLRRKKPATPPGFNPKASTPEGTYYSGTNVGQSSDIVQSSVQQITRDAGKRGRGVFG